MFAFTANRVEMLPPEFIDRAGARFLFNYPTREEQLCDFEIHIAKMRRFDPNHPDANEKGMVRRNPDDNIVLESLVDHTDRNGRQLQVRFKRLSKSPGLAQDEPEKEDFVKGINGKLNELHS